MNPAIFLALALICFVLKGLSVQVWRLDFMNLGFAFLVAALMVAALMV